MTDSRAVAAVLEAGEWDGGSSSLSSTTVFAEACIILSLAFSVSRGAAAGNSWDRILTQKQSQGEERGKFYHQPLNRSGPEIFSPVLRFQKDECFMPGNGNVEKEEREQYR